MGAAGALLGLEEEEERREEDRAVMSVVGLSVGLLSSRLVLSSGLLLSARLLGCCILERSPAVLRTAYSLDLPPPPSPSRLVRYALASHRRVTPLVACAFRTSLPI